MRNLIATLGLQQNQAMNQGRQANQFRRLAKVKFPKFQGDDVRVWVFKCDQFFSIDNTPNEEKVKIMSVHLSDKALLWRRQFLGANGNNVGWDVYKNAIIQRFGSIFEDPMSALKNAKYDKRCSSCNFAEAYSLTALQETILEVVKKKSKPIGNANVSRFGNGGCHGNNNKPSVLPLPASSGGLRPKPNTPVTTPVRKQLTQKEYQEKRAQNLCFYCDQKYTPGHICTGQLYTLVSLADEEDEYFEAKKGNAELNVQEEIANFLECIKWVQYLPNNEGDWEAKKIGCQSRSTCPLAVTVEGGKELISNSQCKGFMWQLQGETFVADMMIFPLGGCEMVLGIKWLATLWDIKCNFKQLRMEFVYKGKRMTLKGTPKPALQWMEGKKQYKEVESVPHAELLMLSVYLNTWLNLMSLQADSNELPKELKEIITAYEDVFEIPKELPPHRSHDHKIPLIEDAGVIKPSQSSFASPIVMVKKKDNTWRMCIDYKQLNKCIVKDKFLILIIKELIDELFGATVFSKLDLRYEYHQIRMYEGDVDKTTFKTHEGHYEFLVMPFGLTNAPFTFQALMNEVFKKFLRKFTLVFFDDILVYNINMEEHVIHLRMVLNTMSSNKLLKYLLDQRITTPTQMKWLPKLMGFDYGVVYEKGSENEAADALSRVENGSELLQLFVSTLMRKDKLVVGANKELRKSLLHYFHDGVIGGHSGLKVTTHKLCSRVYWKGVSVSPYLLVLVLHGLPESIVSDTDTLFVVNRCLEGHLRCMTEEPPKEWSKWLPLAELWYTTNYHTATKTTPFEVVYSQPPPIHVPYFGGVSKVDAVDRSLVARENAIEVLKFHLFGSQNRMKQQADKGRSERTFDVGDMVLLKPQPHRQVTLRHDIQYKFSPRYDGPFTLKKFKGEITDGVQVTPLPKCDVQGRIEVTILERKMVKQRNTLVVYALIQWTNGSREDATWERLEEIIKKYPDFNLDCGQENTLKVGDVIQCRECGYRILYKKRTRRIVQYEAR
nr:hypothetical protein [Tanacetum cinerariifolium]